MIQSPKKIDSSSDSLSKWGSIASTMDLSCFDDDLSSTIEFQNRLKFNNQLFLATPEKLLFMKFAKLEAAANRMSDMSYSEQRYSKLPTPSSSTSSALSKTASPKTLHLNNPLDS
ncbi:hypothetical protein AYI70_g7812 [Smittium culicis]|uniref:Uncharacterized protein n=1 Tax=Smittium culicis TaxID=133412 RepID=A0A1R1XIS9_9FUNG|nr:hypothetical protein AYI70_g11188 [Smittium culicis]OMJ14534.1 hypothetical protein AYI70_g7812 [Smittium culicis]